MCNRFSKIVALPDSLRRLRILHSVPRLLPSFALLSHDHYVTAVTDAMSDPITHFAPPFVGCTFLGDMDADPLPAAKANLKFTLLTVYL